MHVFTLIFGCANLIVFSHCQGLTVIGPKKIRRDSSYTIVLSNFHHQNLRIQAVLTNLNKPQELNESKAIFLSRRTVKSVEFKVGSIFQGDYELAINSLDHTFNFMQNVQLEYDPKTMSIFIQSDKPVYNPGDVIRFRVVVVDIDTRPVTSIKTFAIALKDSDENEIRKWPFARLYNGVFESAVQLSSSPILGKWALTVNATDGLVVTNHIEVKEYVRPTFFVKAYPSKILLQKDEEVSITVETAYTLGEPINGIVKLELYLDETFPKPDFTKIDSITGKKTFNFKLASEVDIHGDDSSKFIKVNVSVQDTFTNRTISITEHVPIYRLPYTVTVLPSSPSFRPGFEFPVSLTVKDHSGKPPREAQSSSVTVNAEFYLPTGSDIQNVTVNLDENGKATFTLNPRSDADQLMITATYESEEYETHSEVIYGFISKSKQYIKIKLNPKYKVQVNREVMFDVSCTEFLKEVSYLVVARGNIVLSSMMKVPNKMTAKLRIKLLPQMSPEARIIVYYTNQEYVIYDDYALKFDDFNNDFKLKLDKDTYIPGEDIYIDVLAAKDSYVALSSIDQSILAIGQGHHDFNRNDVLKELALYDGASDNVFDMFHKWGLFLRSSSQVDAAVSRSPLSRLGGLIGSLKKIGSTPIHVRTNFEESWLWTNFSMDGRKSYKEIEKTVPETITTFQVSGFALSPTLGLGVINQPLKFVVRKPFYLVANLPYSIKRGEVVAIQVTVFNFLGNSLDTEVTLFNKNEEIEFINPSITDTVKQTKTVFTTTDSGKSVSFMVKAKKLGEIAIKFEARNLVDKDSIEHMLRVIPESHLIEKNLN